MKKQAAIISIWLIVLLPVVQAMQGPMVFDLQVAPPNTTSASPSISNVTVTGTDSQTTITWITNQPATGRVEFGVSTLDTNVTSTTLDTVHSLTLQTSQGTIYRYRIESCNNAQQCASTQIATFSSGPLFLNATLPLFSRSQQLDIPGQTKPGATVTITVNGADVRRDTIANGNFLFRSVPLRPNVNNITLTATLNNASVQKTFTTEVDSDLPIMNVSVAQFSLSPTTIANISVSEQVNLTITTKKPQGQQFQFPTDLKVDSVTSQSITLSWAAVPDAHEYGVYRNGTRIATVASPSYQDTSVAPNTRYDYQITAVSIACIESEQSSISATTTVGTASSLAQAPLPSVKLSCEKNPQKLELRQGLNTVSVDLLQGENTVTFIAQDRAGLTAQTEKNVIFSTGPPRFIQTNLGQLSPSYDQNINIKGKLSSAASVTAFVNGAPQKTVTSESDGKFSIPIRLERKVATTGAPRTSLDSGTQWANQIYLQAIDAVGLQAKTEQFIVAYALCGAGSKIDVFLTEPLPDMLNPRLLLEGIQQIGLGFNYTYRGGYNATILANQVRVTKLTLAPDVAKDYDNNLVQANTQVARGSVRGKPSGEGYIQLTFAPVPDPWSFTDGQDTTAPKNPTTYDKESRISDHRKGDCLVPGLGCMKLFLQLEIPFQETSPKLDFDPITRRTIETIKVDNQVQRTCINIETPIDVRINPNVIPSGFLKKTSEFLGKIIESIDKVLKPIQTIGEYLFYSCVAGTLLSAVPIFLEHYNCEYANVASAITGKGKFDPNVAAIGKCDEAYKSDSSAKSKCNTCQGWKEKRKKIEYVYRQICDRTFCPAAPSLQYFMQTRGTKPPTKVNVAGAPLDMGSDCSAWMQKNKGLGNLQRRAPPRLFFTNNDITGIYNDWRTHQSDTAGSTKSKVNCAGLHPANAECCGYEYMQEWSSACGVSALGNSLDTFDEIKESACMSAQKANLNEIKVANGPQVQCNTLLNSVSGFCDKNGGEGPETIQVMPFCCEEGPVATGKLQEKNLGSSKEKYLYIFVIPKSATTSSPFGATTGEYKIKTGYLTETVEFQRSGKASKTSTLEQFDLGTSLKGIAESDDIQTRFFTTVEIEAYYQGKTQSGKYTEFRGYLCKTIAGYGDGNSKPCPLKDDDAAKDIYENVMSLLGAPDREYIIRPGDGLINSARCICIPTLLGYLKLWRNIMAAVRNCINTILLTGDGDAGVCQAVVSQYACDLLYDAIACFAQKFGTPGAGGRPGFGAGGDIIGALTATGTDLSRSVESRYGETSMYKAMFVDRKLVHSICLFAFTGTWNFDLGAVFDSAVDDIPIDSYALLTPCNRRFVSYNPATQPKGLVTWLYHFGVGFAAGSDSTLELHLKCSGGFKCREVDGFARGKCDCDKPEEIIIEPENFPSTVRKGEIVNEEIFYTLQGSPGEGQRRWDQAYIVYRWNDGKQNREEKTTPCTITQTGGAGSVPNFCRFDIATFSFRCQLGETKTGIRFLKAETKAPHLIPEPVFAAGETVDVIVDVKQEYPLPVDFKNNKYLQYTIKNQNGIDVQSNERLVPLTKDGDYTISTKTAFGIAPTVIESWFREGSTTASSKPHDSRTWSSRINPSTSSGGDNVIGTIELGKKLSPGESPSFILVLEGVNPSTEKFELYTASSAEATIVKQDSGFEGKKNKLSDGTLSSSGGVIAYVPPTISAGSTTPLLYDKSVTITLATTRARLATGEKMQVLVTMNPSRAANPCDEKEKTKAQRFTVTFTSYDADNFGQPSEQISTDPLTDLPVQMVQEFYAVCSGVKGIETLEKQKGGEVFLVPLTALDIAISQMQTLETQAKTNLDTFTTKTEIATEISTGRATALFDEIANREAQAQDTLTRLVDNFIIPDAQLAQFANIKGKLDLLKTTHGTSAQALRGHATTVRSATSSDAGQVRDAATSAMSSIDTSLGAKAAALTAIQKKIKEINDLKNPPP